MNKKLIDHKKLALVTIVWTRLTRVNQEMILSIYGSRVMDLIAERPELAKVICSHEGGGPSFAKSISLSAMARYALLVDWIQQVVCKGLLGHPELALSEYGHFAQVLIWVNDLYVADQGQQSEQDQDDELFTVYCLAKMQTAVEEACRIDIEHASMLKQPELVFG